MIVTDEIHVDAVSSDASVQDRDFCTVDEDFDHNDYDDFDHDGAAYMYDFCSHVDAMSF